MKEKMTLECTETFLAGAEDEYGTEWVRVYEFRFPWNDYHFSDHRFFVVKHRIMDWDNACWDVFFNDLRSAMAEFGKEVNRKARYGDGRIERIYGKPKYSEEWKYVRDELVPYCETSERNYSPTNPWDAPGMKVSDFIRGVL